MMLNERANQAWREWLQAEGVGFEEQGAYGFESGFETGAKEERARVADRVGEGIAAGLRVHTVAAFQSSHSACSCDRTWRTHAEHREHVRDALTSMIDGEVES